MDLTPKLPQASNFKLRFRLRSDSYIVDDGWYVDDVLITGYTPVGVAEMPTTAVGDGIGLKLCPSLAHSRVQISYSLAREAVVEIGIYDIAGRQLIRMDQGQKKPGHYEVTWNGRDRSGRKVASGAYFVRVSGGGNSVLTRLAWIR